MCVHSAFAIFYLQRCDRWDDGWERILNFHKKSRDDYRVCRKKWYNSRLFSLSALFNTGSSYALLDSEGKRDSARNALHQVVLSCNIQKAFLCVFYKQTKIKCSYLQNRQKASKIKRCTVGQEMEEYSKNQFCFSKTFLKKYEKNSLFDILLSMPINFFIYCSNFIRILLLLNISLFYNFVCLRFCFNKT